MTAANHSKFTNEKLTAFSVSHVKLSSKNLNTLLKYRILFLLIPETAKNILLVTAITATIYFCLSE